MVTLQDGGVIVEHGELAACVAQEGVGSPRVVHVVNRRGNESSHLIQLVKASLGYGEEQ